MTEQAAAQLTDRLERYGAPWPPADDAVSNGIVANWRALRDSDEPALRRLARWPVGRGYLVDNLPEKIADAYANLLFGEDPTVTAADPADQPRLDAIAAANRLPTELQRAEKVCVSEGEVWWRISVNREASPHPIVTWHSRLDVVPLFFGRALTAAAFTSELPDPAGRAGQSKAIWRHLEIHSRGWVENRLYRGTRQRLGDPQPIDAHPETEGLAETWDHGLAGALAGRVANKLGAHPRLGISDYAGVWTQFLALNEATTIGAENVRLTAKKRVVVPASAATPTPSAAAAGGPAGDMAEPARRGATFDAGEDVLIHDPMMVEEGKEGSGAPFKVLEYSFDASALIEWVTHRIAVICTRCDLVPQFIGEGDFGTGSSGTALRVRLLPTVNAAEGKGRAWDDELPVILGLCQLLEKLPEGLGGLGDQGWSAPESPPAVTRTDALPRDPVEEGMLHATLATAGLLSVETGLRERYPGWDDDQVAAEMERIAADRAATVPQPSFMTN